MKIKKLNLMTQQIHHTLLMHFMAQVVLGQS